MQERSLQSFLAVCPVYLKPPGGYGASVLGLRQRNDETIDPKKSDYPSKRPKQCEGSGRIIYNVVDDDDDGGEDHDEGEDNHDRPKI